MEKLNMEITDLMGNEIKVGDIVAYGDTTSTNNAVICKGEVIDIRRSKAGYQTKIIVKVIKNGGWRSYENTRTFIYPRHYNNLLVI